MVEPQQHAFSRKEAFMKKLTYRVQIQISMRIFLLCFVIAHVTKCGIFTNLGWMIAGLFFVINPVWPKMWDRKDHRYLKLGSRIGGILAIVIGLITRFYP